MRKIWGAALFAATLLGTGCSNPPDAYVEALPSTDALTLEVTGDASEGATAGKTDGVVTSAVEGAPEWLALSREGVRMVNVTVRALMDRVHAFMEANEPTELEDGVRLYGPADEGDVTFRLFVRRLEEEGAFGWRLEAKPVGADDSAYVRVFAGAVRREDDARRGVFGVNLDQLQSVDANFPGQGVLVAGFSARDGNKTLAFRLQQFTPDLAAHRPVSGVFVGHRRADTGATAVRVVTRRNFPIPEGTEQPELLRIRARWLPGTGGHAGLLVTHGDLVEGEGLMGRSCWNVELQEGFKILRHCTGMAPGVMPTCTVVQVAGNREACQLGEPMEPGMDPMHAGLEEGAPDPAVTIPQTEPTGDALP